MIIFVAQIVLNHCVYRLKIKLVLSKQLYNLVKTMNMNDKNEESVMVFQLILSENWPVFL